MSWFDTTQLASFAKSALKEAQKTLDKALDIKEDDVVDAKANEGDVEDAWGSFTGSYFDLNKAPKPEQCPNGVESDEVVTTRPKNQLNRLSVVSTEKSSESLEILGSQSLGTTPDSDIPISTSSSIGLPSCTESVEVFNKN